jgi:hypothetical protein
MHQPVEAKVRTDEKEVGNPHIMAPFTCDSMRPIREENLTYDTIRPRGQEQFLVKV